MCSRPPWAFRPGAAANARRIRPVRVPLTAHCRLRQNQKLCLRPGFAAREELCFVIEHIGFVFIASVDEEMCEKPSKISWRGDGE